MVRRWILTLLVVLAPICVPAALGGQELSVEEIVHRCVGALGGQTQWDAVRSLRVSGSFSTFSVPRPFVLYRQRPNLYRFEYFYDTAEMVVAYDGEMSWWINRSIFSQVPWPEPAPPVHGRAILAEAEMVVPLIGYKEKGHQVEAAGLLDFDGEEAYQLVVRLAHGGVERWYLDPESFLPIARVFRSADSRQEAEQLNYFFDYREVGGVLIPHKVDIELGVRYQSLEIEEVEVNPKLDEGLFKMPLPGDMDRLREMAGTWRVHVRSRPDPRAPWSEEDTTSTLRSFFHGALLEEELVHTVFSTQRHVRQSISYDRFRDVFRVTRFDSLTSHVIVLEGGFDKGRLVVSNLETDTGWTIGDKTFHARQTFSGLSPDGFRVDWEVSADGGKSWDVLTQFQYLRVERIP